MHSGKGTACKVSNCAQKLSVNEAVLTLYCDGDVGEVLKLILVADGDTGALELAGVHGVTLEGCCEYAEGVWAFGS